MWIYDGHLDLGMNAVQCGRDLRRPIDDIRGARTEPHPDQGTATVSFPALADNRIGMVNATLFALPAAAGRDKFDGGWRTVNEGAQQLEDQLVYYHLMHEEGVLRIIKTREDFAACADACTDGETGRVGAVVLLEGADAVAEPADIDSWFERGVRIVGPAWFGPGRYAAGTDAEGPLTKAGVSLLAAMQEAGLILDLSHLADESFFDALDRYRGPVIASHSNCRRFVPGNRQITDEMIRELIARDTVVGAVLCCGMLDPQWTEETKPRRATLDDVAIHIDHVCQLAGNSRHAAIGSDLDGGFGVEESPLGLDTIADLHKLADKLASRGHSPDDVANVLHGNWVRVLGESLPPA